MSKQQSTASNKPNSGVESPHILDRILGSDKVQGDHASTHSKHLPNGALNGFQDSKTLHGATAVTSNTPDSLPDTHGLRVKVKNQDDRTVRHPKEVPPLHSPEGACFRFRTCAGLRRLVETDTNAFNTLMHLATATAVIVFILESIPDLDQYEIPWFYIEYVCVSIFIVEAVIKLLVYQLRYFMIPLHYVDLAAILPFIISLFTSEGTGINLNWLRILRLTKVLRIIKMGSFSTGVKVFSSAITQSVPQLLALSSFLSMSMIIFSSLIYFAEMGVNDQESFRSIPDCFWWCLVTMTTVGYGDAYPVTRMGKLVGAITMLGGMLIFAMPITVIGNKYENATQTEELKLLCNTIQMAIDDMEGEGMNMQELQVLVKASGRFGGVQQMLLSELEGLFGTYDYDGDGLLSSKEMKHLLGDLVSHVDTSLSSMAPSTEIPGSAKSEKEPKEKKGKNEGRHSANFNESSDEGSPIRGKKTSFGDLPPSLSISAAELPTSRSARLRSVDQMTSRSARTRQQHKMEGVEAAIERLSHQVVKGQQEMRERLDDIEKGQADLAALLGKSKTGRGGMLGAFSAQTGRTTKRGGLKLKAPPSPDPEEEEESVDDSASEWSAMGPPTPAPAPAPVPAAAAANSKTKMLSWT